MSGKVSPNSRVRIHNKSEVGEYSPIMKSTKHGIWWEKDVVQDLSDKTFLGIIARYCALSLTIFSPVISSADLASNLYYIIT